MRRLIATVRTRVGACVNRAVWVWSGTLKILRRPFRRRSRDPVLENQLRRRYVFGSIDRETFERGLRYLRRGGRWRPPQGPEPP
jgi:hypothetical protein